MIGLGRVRPQVDGELGLDPQQVAPFQGPIVGPLVALQHAVHQRAALVGIASRRETAAPRRPWASVPSTSRCTRRRKTSSEHRGRPARCPIPSAGRKPVGRSCPRRPARRGHPAPAACSRRQKHRGQDIESTSWQSGSLRCADSCPATRARTVWKTPRPRFPPADPGGRRRPRRRSWAVRPAVAGTPRGPPRNPRAA